MVASHVLPWVIRGRGYPKGLVLPSETNTLGDFSARHCSDAPVTRVCHRNKRLIGNPTRYQTNRTWVFLLSKSLVCPHERTWRFPPNETVFFIVLKRLYFMFPCPRWGRTIPLDIALLFQVVRCQRMKAYGRARSLKWNPLRTKNMMSTFETCSYSLKTLLKSQTRLHLVWIAGLLRQCKILKVAAVEVDSCGGVI